jgi:hypothetical protein
MAIQIFTDEELKKFLSESGFILNVDYLTRDVKLHRIKCQYVNPDSARGMKPSSKTSNQTGEFWYSKNRTELVQKADEFRRKRKFGFALCSECNP